MPSTKSARLPVIMLTVARKQMSCLYTDYFISRGIDNDEIDICRCLSCQTLLEQVTRSNQMSCRYFNTIPVSNSLSILPRFSLNEDSHLMNSIDQVVLHHANVILHPLLLLVISGLVDAICLES